MDLTKEIVEDVQESGAVIDEEKENKTPMSEVSEETPVKTENEPPMSEVNEEVPVGIKNEVPMSALTESMQSDCAAVTLPFPETDYDKNGKLKKVRGRVMKKLLKSEWRHYFPITAALMGIILVVSIFYGFVLRKELRMEANGVYEYDSTMLFLSLSGALLFLLAMAGGVLFSQIYPVARYNKNFFQNEGYLTFSIPASAEEHILAKRIGAILCTVAMGAAVALGAMFVNLISGTTGERIWSEIEYILGVTGVSKGERVLFVIETIVSFLIGLILLPSMYGAMSCILSKSSGKRKTFTVLLLVFLGVGLVESIFSYLLTVGTSWIPATKIGLHISSWITILLETGLTVGCIAVELWYLKRKLDLK